MVVLVDYGPRKSTMRLSKFLMGAESNQIVAMLGGPLDHRRESIDLVTEASHLGHASRVVGRRWVTSRAVKKPPNAHTRTQRRLEASRAHRRLLERRRRARRNRQFNAVGGHRQTRANEQTGKSQEWEDIQVPRALDLLSERAATCAFFALVRQRVKAGHRMRLVFEETERISSESLIYLLAQMQKMRLEHGSNSITGTYPRVPSVERLLRDSGFLQTLGVRQRKLTGRPSSTRYVKCKSDVAPSGESIPELRTELLRDDMLMSKATGSMVFRALSEAMMNVKHHAYENKHLNLQALRGRWWLGGQVSRKKNFLELTFYDAGVGIPKTLHRKYPMEHIRAALALVPLVDPDDAQMIKAAVELGRSRTEKSNRGKGLLDIHKLINSVGQGALTIFSRSGEYRYTPSNETVRNDTNFVEGTLIKWELPLDKVVAFVGDQEDYDEDH